jgi:hypothetical protein
MIFDFEAKQKVIRALAKDSGLSIRYTKEDQPRTDGKTLYVPQPSPDWTIDETLLWEYKIYHELGHVVPEMRDIFDLIKSEKINMASFKGGVFNLLDDHRQEHYKHDLYEGKRKIMARGRGLFLNGQVKSAATPTTDKAAATHALFAWDSMLRTDFQPECLAPALAFYDQLSPKSREYYDKLYDSGDRFVTRNTTAKEEWDIVGDLIKFLGFDDEDEPEDADGDPSDSDGDPEDGEGEDDGGIHKFLFHDHSEVEGEEYGEVKVDKTDAPFIGSSSVVVKDYAHGGYKSYPDTLDTIRHVSATSTGLANTVRKLIQVRSLKHYQHGLKRGKLGKGLHKACIPDAGSYGEKIFKKKTENNMLDTALTVLVDMSGSMYNDYKYAYAARAACMLNEALSRTGVPFSIVCFTYGDGKPIHYILKDFTDRVRVDSMECAFSAVANKMGDNSDGESVIWAYQQIIRRQEKRKIIITLSDGAPACPTRGCYKFTKRVISQIEKEKRVEVYGVGILDDSVKDFYKNNVVIHRPEDLEGALINVIKNKILN